MKAKQLYEYHVWANRQYFNLLKEMDPSIFKKEVESVFSSVSEVFSHIYVVDKIWLGCLVGDDFDTIFSKVQDWDKEAESPTIEAIEEKFLKLTGAFQGFFDKVESEDDPLIVEHPRFGKLHTTYIEIVQHIVNHGTYHRGNLAAMLRQMGHKGASTDYIFYLYALENAERGG
ncbi:DinB family protein [Thalassobacillus hwangdonensis]|uniref:DinB family protein n=1 Tax=Thalassobacillus hwangdonensis TaxID=546108 RepID=A0ABW3L1J1_9BACI